MKDQHDIEYNILRLYQNWVDLILEEMGFPNIAVVFPEDALR